jgi:hypothetical protein
MLDRCYNPNSKSYPRYGGRGIRVCDRWKNSAETFVEDMGPRPSPKHSLDRYPDNDGDYEPGNCRWATSGQQNRNQARNVYIEHDGKRMTIMDWAIHLEMDHRTIYSRYRRHWPIEKVLSKTLYDAHGKPRRPPVSSS